MSGGRPRPGRLRPPQGAFPPSAVRRDRPRAGCEGLGGGRWPERAPARPLLPFGVGDGPRGSRPPGVTAPSRQEQSPSPGAEGDDRLRALLRNRSAPPFPPSASSRGRRRGGPSGEAGSRGRGTGPPAPGAAVRPGRTVLSAPRPRRAAESGRAHEQVRQGSAAKSVTRPTRLVTRTKESNARASRRAESLFWASTPCRRNEGEGREPSPAEVGSRRRQTAAGAPPARLARSVGEVEHERAR